MSELASSTPNADAAYGWLYRGTAHPDPVSHLRWAFLNAITWSSLDQVADVGCDAGQLTLEIAPKVAMITGVDDDRDRLARARKEAERFGVENAVFQHARMTAPAVAEGSCTKVVCALRLHRLPPDQQRRAFRAAAELVRPTGELHVADLVSAFTPEMTEALLARFAAVSEFSPLTPFAVWLKNAFKTTHPLTIATLAEWGIECGLSMLGFGGTLPVLGWVQLVRPAANGSSTELPAVGKAEEDDNDYEVGEGTGTTRPFDFDRR